MHYYKRHLGDYARDTGHLSILEHGVYTLLIDTYYSKEQAPTEAEAIRWARARTPAEVQAVNSVLGEFFVIEGTRFINRRVEEEIASYREVSETNRRIAVEREERKRVRSEHEPCSKRDTDRGESVNLAISHKPLAKKSRSTVQPTSARFPDFWDAYPNKKGKQEAEKRWRKDKLDDRADEIIAHVKTMTAKDDGWQRGYVPMGSTYLNQARWTDVPKSAPLPLNGHTVEPKVQYKTAAETLIPTETKEQRDAAYLAQQRMYGFIE